MNAKALPLLVLFRPATRAWAFYYVWFAFFMTFPVLLAFVVLVLAVRVAGAARRPLALKEG